jgi:hypothetical protein
LLFILKVKYRKKELFLDNNFDLLMKFKEKNRTKRTIFEVIDCVAMGVILWESIIH